MKQTIYKIIDPEDGRIICIGLTNRSKAKTIEWICGGTQVKQINEAISEIKSKGLAPKIVLSSSTVRQGDLDKTMHGLAVLLQTIYLKDKVD